MPRAVLDPNVLVSALISPSGPSYVTTAEVAAYLELIRRESTIMSDPQPAAESLSEAPDDEYLITLARVARVAALVSGDRHLLRLRDRIPVLTSREFLERLG